MPRSKSSPEKAYQLWKTKYAMWEAADYLAFASGKLGLGSWDEKQFYKEVSSHPHILTLRKAAKKAKRAEFDRTLRALPREELRHEREYDKFLRRKDKTAKKGRIVQNMPTGRTFLRDLTPRFYEFLTKLEKDLNKQLSKIPPSIEKAENYLRAAAEFTDIEVPRMYEAVIYLDKHGYDVSRIVKEITKDWREERERTKQRVRGMDPISRDLWDANTPEEARFWISRDFEELLDDICMYRFWRHFSLDGFDAVSANVIRGFEEVLLRGEVGKISFEMSLLSRTEGVHTDLHEAIQGFLVLVPREQNPDGYWATWYARDGHPELTAQCCLTLLRWAGREAMRKAAIEGARWLLESQSPEGFWTKRGKTEDKEIQKQARRKPSIWATCLATQAIIEAGIVKSRHTLELVRDWLLKQQEPVGSWTPGGILPVLSTVIVLETFEAIEGYEPKAEVIETRKEVGGEEPAAFKVYANKGSEKASYKRYEELYRLKAEKKFDLFIDVAKGQTFSLIKGKLNKAKNFRHVEAACLAEYVKKKGTRIYPKKTDVGKERSEAGAIKLFTEARAKVDLQTKGTREYRWFKTHPTGETGYLEYSFEPGDCRYCLIETLPSRGTEPST